MAKFESEANLIYEQVFGEQTPEQVAYELEQFRVDVRYLVHRVAEIRKNNPEITGWVALLDYGKVGVYPDMDSMFEDFDNKGIDRRRTPVQSLNPPENLIL